MATFGPYSAICYGLILSAVTVYSVRSWYAPTFNLDGFSSSLLDDALRPPSTQHTHSPPFNPVSVLIGGLICPPDDSLCGFDCPQAEG